VDLDYHLPNGKKWQSRFIGQAACVYKKQHIVYKTPQCMYGCCVSANWRDFFPFYWY
jgi:hypothetical protein